MKKRMMILTLLLAGSRVLAADYKIRVAGLNCNFCAFTIERLLGKVSGVDKKSINIDVKAGLVDVSSKEGAFSDPVKLREAIEKGGYSFRGMQVSIDGVFVSDAEKLGFQPDGVKTLLPLTHPPKGAVSGLRANIHATVEFTEKNKIALKIEHLKAL